MAKATEKPLIQPVNALTDAEMSEALAPLDKQLRSLIQVQEGIKAYFQARAEIAGLIKARDGYEQEIADAKENLRLTQINIQEQIKADTESIAAKREALEAERKARLQEIDFEISAAEQTINKQKNELSVLGKKLKDRTESHQLAMTKMAEDYEQESARLGQLVAAKQAELDRVTKAFEDFLAQHGMPRPVEVAPVALDG